MLGNFLCFGWDSLTHWVRAHHWGACLTQYFHPFLFACLQYPSALELASYTLKMAS